MAQQYSSLPIPTFDPHDPIHTGLQLAPDSSPQVKWDNGKEVVSSHSHAVLPPTYAKAGGAHDFQDDAAPTKRPWYRRTWVIIGAAIAILVVIGAVVGGVVGTTVGSQASSEEEQNQLEGTDGANPASSTTSSASTLPSQTSTSSVASASPTGIAPNSPLVAAAWQVDDNYDVFLAYHDPDGNLAYTTASGSDPADETSWSSPQRPEPEYPVYGNTPLAMSILPQVPEGTSNSRNIQLEWFFVNETSRINGVNYNAGNSAAGFRDDSINQERFNALGGSNLAAYWPYILYQRQDSGLDLILHTGVAWQGYNTGLEALAGSKLAIVPVSRNATLIRVSGWWGVLYQAEDGRLCSSVDATTAETTGSLGDLKELWQSSEFCNSRCRWIFHVNNAGFPSITIPERGPFAAFSVAAPTSSDPDKVNTFVLYQDEDNDFQQVWFDRDEGGWQTSSPQNLRDADEASPITCVTAPTWAHVQEFGERILGTASELTRCYFHKDGVVVETRLDGLSWTRPVEVLIP
ncbi:hypothetical protein S40293_11436 [Stachybotrys chartarum IBT 40293]|nr:hypothetical protein S40293_11436 [Stachybotrys chartarum IBT 40293]